MKKKYGAYKFTYEIEVSTEDYLTTQEIHKTSTWTNFLPNSNRSIEKCA